LLNESDFQMGVLDNYAGNNKLLEEYQSALKEYKRLKSTLEELLHKELGMRDEEEYIRFQYNEIKAASLQDEELEKLEQEIEILSNAEEIKASLYKANGIVSLGENSVLDRLRDALGSLGRIAGYHADIESFRKRLESVLIELKDMSEGLERLESTVQYNPQQLESLTERLDSINALLQKHRVKDVGELLLVQQELEKKLEGISSLDEDIAKLKEQVHAAEQETEKLALALNSTRKDAIPSVEKEITSSLSQLGMNEGVLKIDLDLLESFTSSGKNQLTFTFSANKGSKPAAISRIASGGELSRLMLAIKSMITAKSLLPTIILDEIDMGVSGDIAAKVGNMLEGMSLNLQLIAITHLPQIAAKAGSHYKVYKNSTGNRTVSEVKCLTEGERIKEIAGMLSDESISSAAKQAAKELLGI